MLQLLVVCSVAALVSCSGGGGGGAGGYQYQLPAVVDARAAGGRAAYNAPYQHDAVNNGDGSYQYSYESNGVSVQESGSPRAQGPEGPAVTAAGSFSYRAPDGQQVALSYTADENGFHPVGAHLPTPPPIPEEILKSLRQYHGY